MAGKVNPRMTLGGKEPPGGSPCYAQRNTFTRCTGIIRELYGETHKLLKEMRQECKVNAREACIGEQMTKCKRKRTV